MDRVEPASVAENGNAIGASVVRQGEVDVVLTRPCHEVRSSEHDPVDSLLDPSTAEEAWVREHPDVGIDGVEVAVHQDHERQAVASCEGEAEEPEVVRVSGANEGDALSPDHELESAEQHCLRQGKVQGWETAKAAARRHPSFDEGVARPEVSCGRGARATLRRLVRTGADERVNAPDVGEEPVEVARQDLRLSPVSENGAERVVTLQREELQLGHVWRAPDERSYDRVGKDEYDDQCRAQHVDRGQYPTQPVRYRHRRKSADRGRRIGMAEEEGLTPVLEAHEGPDQEAAVLPPPEVIVDELFHA